MASKVDIINRGLTKLNAKRIQSLNDSAKNAVDAKGVWDTILDEVLASFPWNFATRRVKLARLSTAPAYGYEYQYRVPTQPKSLRIWEAVTDTEAPIKEWVVEGDDEGLLILTNYATIYLKHTVRIIDTERFSPWMVECLATRLASELAYPVTGKRTTAQELLKEYMGKIEIAAVNEAQQGLDYKPDETKLPIEEDWVGCRS